MRRSGLRSDLMLIALFMVDGFLMAQGAVSSRPIVASHTLPGWDEVERLKPGTKVIVGQDLMPGEFVPWRPCRVVQVDATALTCVPDGERGRQAQRVVYPAGEVRSVCQLKLHVPWIRMVVYGGIGAVVGGVVLTGENWNTSLGAAGAIVGGMNAVFTDPPKTQRVLVYQRMPEPLTPSMESAFDELEGRSLSR